MSEPLVIDKPIAEDGVPDDNAGNPVERCEEIKTNRRRQFIERIVLMITVLLLILIVSLQGYWVAGDCMEPDYTPGDRLLADKISYRFDAPKRGDIVVFRYPRDPRQVYVKRIIGLPGDYVEIHNGDVYINHHYLNEPYRIIPAHGSMESRFIPNGSYFVMGDNRDVSDDSRYWGTLPSKNIIGRAVGKYWPLWHNHEHVFASRR